MKGPAEFVEWRRSGTAILYPRGIPNMPRRRAQRIWEEGGAWASGRLDWTTAMCEDIEQHDAAGGDPHRRIRNRWALGVAWAFDRWLVSGPPDQTELARVLWRDRHETGTTPTAEAAVSIVEAARRLVP